MALLNETESVLSYLDKEVSGSSSWLRVWGAGPRLKSWDVLLSSPGHLLLLAGLRPHTEDPASRQRRDPSGAPLPGRCSRDATRGSVQAAWCVCVCVGGVGGLQGERNEQARKTSRKSTDRMREEKKKTERERSMETNPA